jgi:hypothetical protein
MVASLITKVYNGDEVFFTFGPVTVISGRADDEFLTITQESDDAVDVAGTDGEVAVSRTNDKRATIVVKLLQTADANDKLSEIRSRYINMPGGAGGFWGLNICDIINGRSMYSSATAWIQKAPDVAFGREPGTREWSLRASHLVRHDGGNNLVVGAPAQPNLSTQKPIRSIT